MAHLHEVRDSESRFIIDTVTRTITSESSKKKTVIQGDHNSERFTFEIPCVDGHDMSICNKVEIHYINIDGTDKTKKSPGVYEADDLASSGDVVTFTWLLSRTGTQYAGTLNFLVHFACIVDGVEEYAWNTGIFQSITVGSGMNNGTEEAIEPYLDVLAQWKARLFGIGDTEEQRLLAVSQEQQEIIAATGHAVLETIPDEYEELSDLADQNRRNKAGAIVLDSEGENIVVNDASEYPLQGLKLFGKSTQDGTPTPDAPVDIVSLENPVVNICGKNLIPFPYNETTKTKNGVTFTINDDGSIKIQGTATKATNLSIFSGSLPLNGIFTLSGVTNEKTPSTHYMQPYVDDVFQSSLTNGSQTYEINGNLTAITLYVKNGESVDCVVYPQLEIGSVATEYEPPTTQIVETYYTLPGIPVSSGGNYTDENGQEWICDEVDFERGVHIKRTTELVFDGDENPQNTWYPSIVIDVSTNARVKSQPNPLCNYFEKVQCGNPGGTTLAFGNMDKCGIENADAFNDFVLQKYAEGNPVKVVYPLATPIETAFSDAELTAFKALHTNKPNTTILNDSGAYMSVEYVADTKTYIDNKIAEYLKGSE